jgi:hypothetical protein
MQTADLRSPGWILCSGLALLALGLATEGRSQGSDTPTTPPGNTTRTVPVPMGFGTADSNGRMIAVTGVDLTGGSLLYLVDTESRHLSVYQASGGTKSTMNIKWVGARNIDLDLSVDGWNDRSEYSFKQLAEQFEKGADVSLPDK